METTIYSDGTYLRNNPAWHADDSAWKANHIATMLQRHGLAPATVCAVGCGAGEILRNLAARLDPAARFTGYEISPTAYKLCAHKSNDRVAFRFGNLLKTHERFDLVMAIDVFEHVE